jgi:tetratricopeptide (TPR) repeat protein
MALSPMKEASAANFTVTTPGLSCVQNSPDPVSDRALVRNLNRMVERGEFAEAEAEAHEALDKDLVKGCEERKEVRILHLQAAEPLWNDTKRVRYALRIIADLEELAELDPTLERHIELSMWYAQIRDYNNAIVSAMTAIKMGGARVDWAVMLAGYLENAERYKDALEIYSAIYEETEILPLLVKRGRCYLELRDTDNAIKDLKKAIKRYKKIFGDRNIRDENRALALYLLGQIYFDLGKREAAYGLYSEAKELGSAGKWYPDAQQNSTPQTGPSAQSERQRREQQKQQEDREKSEARREIGDA